MYDSSQVKVNTLEIGIAMKEIDLMFPGKIPFSIPVLTPTMPRSKPTTKKIIQSGKSNILTENAGAIDVSTIETTNAIYIEIPKELTCLPAPIYDIDGTVNIEGPGDITIKGSQEGSGVVSDPGGYINVNGTVDGTHDILIKDGHIWGTIKTELNKKNRYIKKGSKWLICFIGGDTSMPRVICRLPD